MVKTRLGEKAADRGNGFGPWTVQASFKAEEGGIRDLGLERAAAREADGSNSRYDEPDAEGMRPFLRTACQWLASFHCFGGNAIQIFRSSAGCRWRRARSPAPVPDCATGAKTTGRVPPGGPLTRRLSAMTMGLSRIGNDIEIMEIQSQHWSGCLQGLHPAPPRAFLRFFRAFAFPLSFSPHNNECLAWKPKQDFKPFPWIQEWSVFVFD